MEFWKMCWEYKAITLDMLRQATITETNPYGDITKEEYKTICGLDYDTPKPPIDSQTQPKETTPVQ